MSYTLLGSDGRSYESDKKGQWGRAPWRQDLRPP